MNLMKKLFGRSTRISGGRFERYYGNVARSGAGFPTADEARKDLRMREPHNSPYGWTL